MVTAKKTEPIRVWRFEAAPPRFQKLSRNGGDEDWVVLIPAHLADEETYIPWLHWIDTCGDPEVHKLKDGCVVYIGCHA